MKVFSKEKFIERMGKEHYNGLMRDNNGKNWADKADGCEVKDGRVWPFFVVDEWCIEKEESKLEVRKFRCVGYNQGEEKYFTVGKVYEEKDGKMLNDDGYEYGVVFGELPHEWLQMWYKFEEVKEDKNPKLTIKDFIEKKIAVHIKRDGDAKDFLKLCEEEGLRWVNGSAATCFVPHASGSGYYLMFNVFNTNRMCFVDADDFRALEGYKWKTVNVSDFLGMDEEVKCKIVIECNDAKTTVARMIVNGKEVKHAKARCCPDDEFNLATGVRIAIDRMFEKK